MRTHLTYSNVMATIAVFAVLGGGAWAASSLPKDSVGTKQLKDKAVETSKLDSKSVTAKKLQKQVVTGAKVAKKTLLGNNLADDTVTGTQVKESSLGEVPLATEAGAVDGSSVQQVSYGAAAGTGPELLFEAAGLTVTAECPAVAPPGGVILTATTDTNDSILGLPEIINGNAAGVDDEFNAGEPQSLQIDDTTASMSYGRGTNSTPVVTATFLGNQWTGGGGECKVVGTVVTDG